MRKTNASIFRMISSVLLVLVVFAACFAGLRITSRAAENGSGYRVVVEDGADLFSDSEEARLISELAKNAEFGNMAVTITNKPALFGKVK